MHMRHAYSSANNRLDLVEKRFGSMAATDVRSRTARRLCLTLAKRIADSADLGNDGKRHCRGIKHDRDCDHTNEEYGGCRPFESWLGKDSNGIFCL